MFPFGADSDPEPDVIGAAGKAPGSEGPGGERWRRYLMAGGVLALAGIVAATALSSQGKRATVAQPRNKPSPAVPAPSGGSVVPSQAWLDSLNLANWPMYGNAASSFVTMFAGGAVGNHGWMLTLTGVPRPGNQCVAEVLLDGRDAYQVRAHPPVRTPAGDLAFIPLGTGSPAVGVGLVQSTSAGQVWIEPGGLGGFQISVPVLPESACGITYYLAGFAYPMAGSLDVWSERGGPGSHEYAVPTRLSRPEAPGVWVSAG
jgi:hypothetical protein